MVVAHTFNPSTLESRAFNSNTREVETGKDMAGQREEYQVGGNMSIQSEDMWRQNLAHFGLRIR